MGAFFILDKKNFCGIMINGGETMSNSSGVGVLEGLAVAALVLAIVAIILMAARRRANANYTHQNSGDQPRPELSLFSKALDVLSESASGSISIWMGQGRMPAMFGSGFKGMGYVSNQQTTTSTPSPPQPSQQSPSQSSTPTS